MLLLELLNHGIPHLKKIEIVLQERPAGWEIFMRNCRRNKIYGRSSLPPNFPRISVRKLGRKYLRSPNNTTRHAILFIRGKTASPTLPGQSGRCEKFYRFFSVPRFKILTTQKFLPPLGKVISGTVVFIEVIYLWVSKERLGASGSCSTSADVPTPK